MQRLTARLLLLFALVGTILPVALQATVTPQHACCRRQGAHHCHESSSDSLNHPVVNSRGCCNHDCCRTVTTSHWAHPEPQAQGSTAHLASAGVQEPNSTDASALSLTFLSTRAPPQLSIA